MKWLKLKRINLLILYFLDKTFDYIIYIVYVLLSVVHRLRVWSLPFTLYKLCM